PAYLFVVPWDTKHVSGVTAVVRNLIAQMRASDGPRPELAVNDWVAARPRKIDDEWRFRFSVVGRLAVLPLLVAMVKMPWRLAVIRAFLHVQHVDVVNFHYLTIDALGVAILKLMGLYRGRLVISVHGTDVRPASNAFEKISRKLIFRASSHI